jgi:indole-3-glycerol phosphate synthase
VTILEKIALRKRAEIEDASLPDRMAELRAEALDQAPVRPFREALATSSHPVALIAEVKKASPSQGVIREVFVPEEIAQQYRDAGADCLSVLTDRDFFQGDHTFLATCREASGLPCLRKDFIIHPAQVWESRILGADCILLIAAMLTHDEIEELHALGREAGMDVLVEVHDEEEAEHVPTEATLVGINNRSLHTFAEDFDTTERLIKVLEKPGRLMVSESSIARHDQVLRVQQAGARAVLVGTAFCRAENPGAMVKEVMGWD